MLPLQRQNAIIVTHGCKPWLTTYNVTNKMSKTVYSTVNCLQLFTVALHVTCKICIVLILNAFYNYSTKNTTTELLQIITTINNCLFRLLLMLYIFKIFKKILDDANLCEHFRWCKLSINSWNCYIIIIMITACNHCFHLCSSFLLKYCH